MAKNKKAAGHNEPSIPGGLPDKYFADQFDDEEVLFVFRKHPVVMRKGLIAAAITVLLGALIGLGLVTFREASLTVYFLSMAAGFVFGAIVFLPAWIGWYFSVFIVTDQRLIQITQKGLFHRSVVDMGLDQIQMVNYQVSGLQETLLGFGTIMMQTLVGDLVIHDIHHPANIQKKILEVLRSRGIAVRPATAMMPGRQSNQQLAQSQDQEDDSIDEDDYEAEEG